LDDQQNTPAASGNPQRRTIVRRTVNLANIAAYVVARIVRVQLSRANIWGIANYMLSNQLGGIMIWELAADDDQDTLVNASRLRLSRSPMATARRPPQTCKLRITLTPMR
jgi:hypothetical protein